MKKDSRIKFWNLFEKEFNKRNFIEYEAVRIHDNAETNCSFYEIILTDAFYSFVCRKNLGISIGLSIANIHRLNGEYPAIHIIFDGEGDNYAKRSEFERICSPFFTHKIHQDNLGTLNLSYRSVIPNEEIMLPNFFDEDDSRIIDSINWMLDKLDLFIIYAKKGASVF